MRAVVRGRVVGEVELLNDGVFSRSNEMTAPYRVIFEWPRRDGDGEGNHVYETGEQAIKSARMIWRFP